MDDTRKAPRIEVTLPARWEGVLDQRGGTVTSLSADGCFVLSGGEVKPGELLRIEIDLPYQESVYCWCEVTDQAGEIGFAVRFNLLEELGQARLAEFIQQFLSASPGRQGILNDLRDGRPPAD
jgi:hypothetical protein